MGPSLLSRLGIQSKLLLAMLLLTLLSVGTMGALGYRSARVTLREGALKQLEAVRHAKSSALRAMLTALRNQVQALSDSQIVVDGTLAFRQAFAATRNQRLAPDQLQRLRQFYQEQFLPELAKTRVGTPVLEQYLPEGPAEQWLQYFYLADNQNSYNQKRNLVTAPLESTGYDAVHQQFHPRLVRASQLFQFDDILLVDAETLDILYSVEKQSEFATNLDTGPYSNTLLAAGVKKMIKARDRDDFKIVDFEPYAPALGLGEGFALSPIFDGPEMIGILVLQFPSSKFTEVITGNFGWEKEGLGQTGECYLVGPDYTFRSRSRFMVENPKAFIAELRSRGINKSVVDQIEKQQSVLNVLEVRNDSVRNAFQGKEGIHETLDYRGQPVLSSYGSLELDSLRWAVIAEIDSEEAFRPIRDYARSAILLGSGLVLGSSLLAIALAHLLSRPLRRLTEGARRIGRGDTSVRIPVVGTDEYAEVTEVFNEMAGSLRAQTKQLEARIQENQELLLNILPEPAVAMRRDGDEKATKQFADVSVLMAEIGGLEALGEKMDESRAMSLLGDLVTVFDEVADRVGVEKVRTIGASYLAVCGLSIHRPDHLNRILQFAKEITEVVNRVNREHQTQLTIGIGVNTGPVVGGVVGRRKFLYDLWGDTVNLASRLARSGTPAILVTKDVYEKTKDLLSYRPGSPMEVPGKGSLAHWQLDPSDS